MEDLIVITAMTGNEWPITGELVRRAILPLLARYGIRYVQVARGGPSQRDGVSVLYDSTFPHELFIGGDFTLGEELVAAGTVPQSGGARLCSAKSKGFPLDATIAQLVGSSPYRHVIGFEAGERRRAAKDTLYNTSLRTGEYPLIEWGWNRSDCERFIGRLLGIRWVRSACSFCPFALATEEGRARVLARFAADPATGVDALLMEHLAVALNPAQGLIAGKRLFDLIHRTPGQDAVQRLFASVLDELDWSMYEVKRVLRPKGSTSKVANAVRSVTALPLDGARGGRTIGQRSEAETALSGLAEANDREIESDGPHRRLWMRHRGAMLPTVEHFITVAPALVPDKVGRGFDAAWARAAAAPHQLVLGQLTG